MDEPEPAGEALGSDEDERPSVLAELKERAGNIPPERKNDSHEEVL